MAEINKTNIVYADESDMFYNDFKAQMQVDQPKAVSGGASGFPKPKQGDMVYVDPTITTPIINSNMMRYIYDMNNDYSSSSISQLRSDIEGEKIVLDIIYKAEIDMLPQGIKKYREEECNFKRQRNILKNKLLIIKERMNMDVESNTMDTEYKLFDLLANTNNFTNASFGPQMFFSAGKSVKMEYLYQVEYNTLLMEMEINEERISNLQNARRAKEEKLLDEKQRDQLAAIRDFEQASEDRIIRMEDALREKENEVSSIISTIFKSIATILTLFIAIGVIAFILSKLKLFKGISLTSA
ncbi:hypothetical protein OCOL_001809 [Ordospora colligata]